MAKRAGLKLWNGAAETGDIKVEPDPNEAYVLGVDEAGRGPVLGAMIYGIAWCPVSKKPDLEKLGFMDSKQLTDAKRDKLLDVMDATDYLHYGVDVLEPDVISAWMLQKERYNLNAMSHDSTIGLIRSIQNKGFNLTEAFIDTVGVAFRYEAKLSSLFPGIKFTVTSKADDLFKIVSAASIAAKVTRDRRIAAWDFKPGELKTEEGKEMGSGYPGDPKTKEWLAENVDEFWGPPDICRYSWAPAKKLMEADCVEVDYGIPDDDEEDAFEARKATGGGIAQFFGGSSVGVKRQRTSYFGGRNMQPCLAF
jgi:ribonuclease H2 subunit A